MKTMKNKCSLILAGLLLCSLLLRASETVSLSDDTIPSRYRNYYYTHWYDECTAYQDGGWVDSCWYFQFRALYAANKPIKREYTNGPLKVKGIVAMIALEPHVGYSFHKIQERCIGLRID